MGTRGLIGVVVDEQFKVAKYNQFDSYPSILGAHLLEFLSSTDLEEFKARCRELRFYTNKELAEIENDRNWLQNYPHLSRDAIYDGYLEGIYDGEIRVVCDNSTFVADSLFCEWAYIIDLDKGTFEVYKGFNTRPLGKKQRFYNMPVRDKQSETTYYPVRLVKKYKLDDLPTAVVLWMDTDPGDFEQRTNIDYSARNIKTMRSELMLEVDQEVGQYSPTTAFRPVRNIPARLAAVRLPRQLPAIALAAVTCSDSGPILYKCRTLRNLRRVQSRPICRGV